MIQRNAEKELRILSKQFKAIAIVGPRQSGKTTLARYVFSHLPYINLENPDTRRYAIEDPRGFLGNYKNGAIFDEIQRTPEIFSYLQEILDETKSPGRFILTGSNNFLLQENITQSLAGRIAYLTLLPFSLAEVTTLAKQELNEQIFTGFYPPIYDQNLDALKWYSNYIRTYVERDVRQLKNISDLNAFDRFIKLCAGRIGQLLNKSNLAIETGVDNKTIDSWLSVLESSFIIYRLQPYHKNFNKRIVKMPKIYFYDTGLACNLLGINNSTQLETHYLKGNIFENFVISEYFKSKFHYGKLNNFYFWRDNIGHEIDLIIDKTVSIVPIEIKSGKTIHDEFFKNLRYWLKLAGEKEGKIIYAGDFDQKRSEGIEVISWKNFSLFD
ncbi:MAG TPA: ATP-binding protein [Bacteroidales bacterium]|nr:ATP-binding protein [Bacteroidales bacterium]